MRKPLFSPGSTFRSSSPPTISPPRGHRIASPKEEVDFLASEKDLGRALAMVRDFGTLSRGRRSNSVKEMGRDNWHAAKTKKAYARLKVDSSQPVIFKGAEYRSPKEVRGRPLALNIIEEGEARVLNSQRIRDENRLKLRNALIIRASGAGGVESLFKRLDTDCDGGIAPDELSSAVQSWGSFPLTRDEINQLHGALDLNNDGLIDMGELTKFVGAIQSTSKSKRTRNPLSPTTFDPAVRAYRPRRGDFRGEKARNTIQRLVNHKLIDPRSHRVVDHVDPDFLMYQDVDPARHDPNVTGRFRTPQALKPAKRFLAF